MPRFSPLLSIIVETYLKVMLPAKWLFGALHCSLILVQFPDEVEFWTTCSHIIMKIILASIVETTSQLCDISKKINVGLLESNNEAYKYKLKLLWMFEIKNNWYFWIEIQKTCS